VYFFLCLDMLGIVVVRVLLCSFKLCTGTDSQLLFTVSNCVCVCVCVCGGGVGRMTHRRVSGDRVTYSDTGTEETVNYYLHRKLLLTYHT
jgi:hypothetical protein